MSLMAHQGNLASDTRTQSPPENLQPITDHLRCLYQHCLSPTISYVEHFDGAKRHLAWLDSTNSCPPHGGQQSGNGMMQMFCTRTCCDVADVCVVGVRDPKGCRIVVGNEHAIGHLAEGRHSCNQQHLFCPDTNECFNSQKIAGCQQHTA